MMSMLPYPTTSFQPSCRIAPEEQRIPLVVATKWQVLFAGSRLAFRNMR